MAISLAIAGSWLVALPVRAADPEFGRQTITGSFGEDIVVTQRLTLDAPPDRVEVLVTTADGPAPLVTEVPPPSDIGSTTLRHTLGGTDGHILPNTPVRVRWRVTTDGVVALGPEVRTVVTDERFDWQDRKSVV